MPIQQLKTKDLKPGDILLKFSDGSWISKVIKTGEKLLDKKENSDVVHAGLLFDNNIIIEAQGSGVSANDLRVGNKKYGYIVFRCKNANMASGSAEFAKVLFDSHQNNQKQSYDLFGAVSSLFKKKDKIPKTEDLEARVDGIFDNKKHKFFCSQFVVFVYQFVAEQNGIKAADVFGKKDTLVAPSYLATALVDNAKYFEEVGYLMPNER